MTMTSFEVDSEDGSNDDDDKMKLATLHSSHVDPRAQRHDSGSEKTGDGQQQDLLGIRACIRRTAHRKSRTPWPTSRW